ncbi:MAG: ribonuclease H-like domain-containing protein [Synergistaceae bacterium]|nr:ribonuclease H-like domain-containing protein [Synergistaceae bacterium]
MEALIILVLIVAYVLHRKMKKENQKLRERNKALEPLAETNQEIERLTIEAKEKLYQAELREKAAQEYMASVVSEAREKSLDIIRQAEVVAQQIVESARILQKKSRENTEEPAVSDIAIEAVERPDTSVMIARQKVIPSTDESCEKIRRFKGKSLVDFPDEFCVVDVETTGLTPASDSIIEIGAIKYSNDKPIDSFQSLINPEMKISKIITKITGITNEMLEDVPKAGKVLPLFYNFLGNSLVVGYNVNFDINFLYDAYQRYLGFPLTNDFVDVLRITRRLYPNLPRHRLSDVLKYFELDFQNLHRALDDCVATFICYTRCKRDVMEKYGAVDAFIKCSKRGKKGG